MNLGQDGNDQIRSVYQKLAIYEMKELFFCQSTFKRFPRPLQMSKS